MFTIIYLTIAAIVGFLIIWATFLGLPSNYDTPTPIIYIFGLSSAIVIVIFGFVLGLEKDIRWFKRKKKK